jgi:DNA-binding MarR family transcriptional regulator
MEDKNLEFINNELMTLIRRSSLDKKLGGLDRSTYTLLGHLSIHESIGVKALAEHFGLDISTISRQASVMEAKGYVVRLPDSQDGRSSYFQITELGAEKLMEAKKARLDRYEQLFEVWSAEECQTFGTLLARLNRTLLE